MRILVTNHHLADFAGTEIFTYELAKGLKKAGHTVVVYSRYINKLQPFFALEGILLVHNLAEIADYTFDVAHVQHSINALEVRQFFPNLPIFFMSHGSQSFLEKPPVLDINISQYGAISELVKQKLVTVGVKQNTITMVSNMVDESLFFPTSVIRSTPKQALILSNRIDRKTEQVIREACQHLGIDVTCIGARFKKVNNSELPHYINRADIVFTIGRGVLETIMCGRIPIILDHRGGDGMVTPQNQSLLEKYHYSGRYKEHKFTVKQIKTEIGKYRTEYAKELRGIALKRYAVPAVIKKLENLYLKTIKTYKAKPIDTKMLKYIVDAIHVTRVHTFSRSEMYSPRHALFDLKVLFSAHLSKFFQHTMQRRPNTLSLRS